MQKRRRRPVAKKRRRRSDVAVILVAAVAAGALVAMSGLGVVMTVATVVFFGAGLAMARLWIRGH